MAESGLNPSRGSGMPKSILKNKDGTTSRFDSTEKSHSQGFSQGMNTSREMNEESAWEPSPGIGMLPVENLGYVK